jgi:hypothetical protein
MAMSGHPMTHVAIGRVSAAMFSYKHTLQTGKQLRLGDWTIRFDVYRFNRVTQRNLEAPNDGKSI